ncbi:MAG: hypothetical protein ACKVQC_01295, partial [Elusimicrobiota bacterium]
MRIYLFLLLIVFSPVVFISADSSVQLKSEVGPKDGYIGDIINVRFTLIHSQSATPLPIYLEKKIGEFEVLSSTLSFSQKAEKEKIKASYLLKLIIFSTGTQIIPVLNLPLRLLDGTTTQITSDPIEIQIKSLLAEKGDEGNLRPLKGFINFKSYFWFFLIALILLGISLTYFIYRKFKKNFSKDINRSLPVIPAYQTAEE